MAFIDLMKEKAKQDVMTIILPESNDKRTLIAAAVSVSIIFRSDLLIPLNIYNKDRRTTDIDRHRHCCAVDHGGTGYIRHIDRDLLVMAALLFNNIDRFINPRFFRHDHQGRIPFFQESAGRGKTGHAEFVFCE